MSSILLVLGGSALAAPVLRWAREADLETVLVDADPHAPLRRTAHEFHVIPAGAPEAHAALARRLAKRARLCGVLAIAPQSLGVLEALSDAVPSLLPSRRSLECLLAGAPARDAWRAQGLAVAEPREGAGALDVFAFFRDGAFVPGGIAARRTLADGDVLSVQPTGLAADEQRAAYVLVERAARSLGFEQGPLQAVLSPELALQTLLPGFGDLLGATHVARLAYGKSPLQAWFAHLAGAGGPFDELALAPRCSAGWLALAPRRAGRFAGFDGVARARALPGVVDLWIEEPGRELVSPELAQRALGYLWAEGHDAEELEQRLHAARAVLEVRIAGRQRVA